MGWGMRNEASRLASSCYIGLFLYYGDLLACLYRWTGWPGVAWPGDSLPVSLRSRLLRTRAIVDPVLGGQDVTS